MPLHEGLRLIQYFPENIRWLFPLLGTAPPHLLSLPHPAGGLGFLWRKFGKPRQQGQRACKSQEAGTESRKGNLPTAVCFLTSSHLSKENSGLQVFKRYRRKGSRWILPHLQTKNGFVYSTDPSKAFPTSAWI